MSANTIGGYAGKILRVDLTNERITEEVLDEATLRKWVGGVGFGAKYLYEEVPPGVEWNDPANRIIVASGPLGGTMVGGSGIISISTKGCLTNGATSTQANGFMGAFMKSSGFDAVIFEGIAPRWVYLYMHDGTAELRDARHLLGKNTWETEDGIKAELGYVDRQMSVFCIGPAGENLVKYAGIFGDKDHCAGHNGIGAVMGVKKLKAFCAPLGRTPIKVASPKKLLPAIEAIWRAMQKDPGSKRIFDMGTGGDYGTGDQRVAAGTLPVKNYLTNLYPEARVMTCQYVRERWSATPRPCWACGSHHCHMVTITDGPHRGLKVEEPEYEMFAAWGPLVGNTDPAEALVMSNLTTLLGLEGNEAGFIVSMVIELYEKGILTKEDTEGLELTWGNNAAIRQLLERIARREGAFADMLAEGIKHAAETLGEEAKNCAIYTMKGHAPRGHDHRAFWREMFDTATSDAGTYSSGYLGPADPDTHSLKAKFSPEEVSTHIAKTKGRRQFEDMLGHVFLLRSGAAALFGGRAQRGYRMGFHGQGSAGCRPPGGQPDARLQSPARRRCRPRTAFPALEFHPRRRPCQGHQHHAALGRHDGQLLSAYGLGQADREAVSGNVTSLGTGFRCRRPLDRYHGLSGLEDLRLK